MKSYTLFLLNLLCCLFVFAQASFDQLTDTGYQQLANGNPAALQTLEHARIVLPATLDLQSKADFYNNLGVAYYQAGEYKKGLDVYERSLEIYRRMNNDSLVAGALLNLGLAYKEIGAFRQATEALTQAARLSERYENQQELAAAWNAIGNIQREAGNFPKSLAYHLRALRIREAIAYEKGVADSYHNIGNLYLEWKQYEKSEYYLLKALARKKAINNQSNMVNTLAALGRLYVAKQLHRKALFYLDMAYGMRLEAGNSTKAASSLFDLATFYAATHDRIKALELFHQTQELARGSADNALLAEALFGEIALLEASGNATVLVTKYRELVLARQLQADDANRKEMARLEVEYDIERKEREIEMRRKQAKLDHARLQNERLQNQQLIGWIVGLASLVSVVLALLYQIRQRKQYIELQNTELQEQRDEITHLHHELSHRTKNYFSLLSGILKSDKAHAKHEETSRVLQQNVRRLEAMSLVQHYLLDDSARHNKEVRLDAYLGKLVDLIVFNLFPADGDLKLTRDIDAVYLDYDLAMRLAITLNELLCNAIEHSLLQADNPRLGVSVKQWGKKVELIVRDNGPGISEQQIQSQKIKGQGLIAKLLHKVNGTIQYRNEDGCVATVAVSI